MTHTDLVAFLRRARKTLREETTDSYIFVKENVCEDMNGQPREFLDEEDSSLTRWVASRLFVPSLFHFSSHTVLVSAEFSCCRYACWNRIADTRSNGKWLQVFAEAGLSVIKEEVQVGMPVELFTVKT